MRSPWKEGEIRLEVDKTDSMVNSHTGQDSRVAKINQSRGTFPTMLI